MSHTLSHTLSDNRTTLLLAASALVLGAIAVYGTRRLAPAQADHPTIRPAGPHAMVHPPRQWSLVDEQSDQSFPASDPPGNY
jgi:hypothetical protein